MLLVLKDKIFKSENRYRITNLILLPVPENRHSHSFCNPKNSSVQFSFANTQEMHRNIQMTITWSRFDSIFMTDNGQKGHKGCLVKVSHLRNANAINILWLNMLCWESHIVNVEQQKTVPYLVSKVLGLLDSIPMCFLNWHWIMLFCVGTKASLFCRCIFFCLYVCWQFPCKTILELIFFF